jgi:hypothetical protein
VESEEMPIALRLAAIVNLLSSSALRGATANKTEALRSHLQAAVDTPNLDPYLKSALQEVLGGWQAKHCHPNSISVDFYPLTVPGSLTH